jgi:putative endopeptidase
MNRRAFLTASGGAIAASAFSGLMAEAHAQAARRAVLGRHGLELTARDLTVKPGDDFFSHVNGTWMKTTQIPGDRTRWGSFDALRDKAEREVRAIIEELAGKTGAAPGSIEQKIGDYYRAFMDTAAIERAGLAPIQADLAKIAALKDHVEVAQLIASPDVPVNGPLGAGVGLDDGNPDRYVVVIGQGGIHLPEREYYLKDDARFTEIRTKYKAHVAKLLTLAGQSNADAKAAAIFALETEMAKRHQPIEDLRDSTKMYNPKSRAEVKALAPNFPWDEAFAAGGFANVQNFVVGPVTAVGALGEYFRATPLDTWKAYLTYALVRNRATLLPKAVDDEVFDFYGRTLNGQPQQRDRWKRATQALNGALGEAIGQVYVQRHFSPNAKRMMVDLVENLRKGFAQRIDGLTWMSAETKVVARQKLATFRPKVGYPDKWRDYSGLEVRAGDAIGNAQRSAMFEWKRDVARLGTPTDKDEWFMTPQTVNAYYNPVFNEIVFPAAILQAPFFDEHADTAVNYGGIGGVIGHEMGHGFDDQGAKYDPQGVLRNWWNERDVAAFEALSAKMIAQYGRFEALPGVNVNGQLTIGENIGDHCGVTVGLAAYKIALGRRRAPVLEGLTGEQRFFMSWGQIWRTLIRDEALRNQVQTDPHSPGRFRCNGAVQNVDAWYAAFNVQAGDKLYVAPADRVHIW